MSDETQQIAHGGLGEHQKGTLTAADATVALSLISGVIQGSGRHSSPGDGASSPLSQLLEQLRAAAEGAAQDATVWATTAGEAEGRGDGEAARRAREQEQRAAHRAVHTVAMMESALAMRGPMVDDGSRIADAVSRLSDTLERTANRGAPQLDEEQKAINERIRQRRKASRDDGGLADPAQLNEIVARFAEAWKGETDQII